MKSVKCYIVGHVKRVRKCIEFLSAKDETNEKHYRPGYNIKMFVIAVELRSEYLITDYPNWAQSLWLANTVTNRWVSWYQIFSSIARYKLFTSGLVDRLLESSFILYVSRSVKLCWVRFWIWPSAWRCSYYRNKSMMVEPRDSTLL